MDQVDQIQDDASNLVGNQISDKGLLKPVGQYMSKEGINRAERNGKDENGSYGVPGPLADAGTKGANSIGSGLSQGAESGKNLASGGVSGVKNLLGGGK